MPIPVFGDGGGDWRHALLTALGAPSTPDNLNALNAWASSEGVDPRNNNWLAITDPNNRWPHAGVVASNGGNPVYAFPSQAVGVQATAAFLAGSYYVGVVDALKANRGVRAVYNAINSSPWCKGCQGGNYPIVLHNALNGGGFGQGPGVGQEAAPGQGPSDSSGGTPVDTNRCLLGGQGGTDIIPGPLPFGLSTPDVPCLFYESWGHAIIGALVLVGGGTLLLIGVYMAANGSRPRLAAVPSFAPRVPMRG